MSTNTGIEKGACASPSMEMLEPRLLLSVAWSSYLGGSGVDGAYGVVADASGNTYVSGHTDSADLPNATNAISTGTDAFVMKVDSTGAVVWSTYVGGTGSDAGTNLVLDASGNILFVGDTNSDDLPLAGNAYHGGTSDVFVAKLDATGALLWTTYLGGSLSEGGSYGNAPVGIAVDAAGNPYVMGWTYSTDFAGASNALAGADDVFVAKLSSTGAPLWATLVGGSDNDWGQSIVLDPAGNAFIAGGTRSADLPAALNAGETSSTHWDAFAAEVSVGGALVWTSYLGGTLDDEGDSIARDPAGNLLIAGDTSSTDFAGATNTYQGGSSDAFVAKMTPWGTLTWATYLGGSGAEAAFSGGETPVHLDNYPAVASDALGNAIVTGVTASTDFAGATNAYLGGNTDGFIALVGTNGTQLYATYLGGSGDDSADGVTIDSTGAALVVGGTTSTDLPAATNASLGNGDAFLMRLTNLGGANVLAYQVGADLYLVGDAFADDAQVIVEGAGQFRVESGTTLPTFINGGAVPVDFTGITGNIYAFMGAGDDLLTFTLALLPPVPTATTFEPNIAGNLYVDMGPGNNAFDIGSGGEEIAGNMTVVTGPGNNRVTGEDFIVDGSVMVLNGPGNADTEFAGCTFGSVFIQNAGAPHVALRSIGQFETTTFLVLTIVQGDITILNGVGNDLVALTVVASNVYIFSGPDGLFADVDDSTIFGNLFIYKGDGGTVQAPGSTPGAQDSGTHDAASYTEIISTSIGGTFISHDAFGQDELYMEMVDVGNLPKGVGRPDQPTGSMFIDTEEDASFIYMNDITVNGPTLIKQDGGTDTYTTQGFTTTTALIVGPLLNTNDTVGNGAVNQFYGDFTVINGPGNDGVAFDDSHFWGNVTVLNGQDAAAFGVFDSFFEGSLTWVRGDGGTLPSIPTFFDFVPAGADKPVGFTLMEASSYVTIQTATVTGPLTILNGAGFNYAEIIGLTLGGLPVDDPQAPTVDTGNLLVVNGWGQSRFLMGASSVSGWVTLVDAGGPVAPAPSAPTVFWASSTQIGGLPGGVGGTVDTRIGGNLTILTGPGSDSTSLNSVSVTGNVLIINGPDGAQVMINQANIGGSLTILRGDGGVVPIIGVDGPVGAFTEAGHDMIINSSVGGSTVVINGSGNNVETLSGNNLTGDVTVINGAGFGTFSATGAFGGSLSYYALLTAGDLGVDPVTVGGPTGLTTIAGDLVIRTGALADSVTFFNMAVTGQTTVDTGLGADRVNIDDAAFTGAVNITTGPDFVAAVSLQEVTSFDADTVNIELMTGTSLGTTFAAALTLKTGADDDTVTIGVADNTAGLGATTNNCFADFFVSPTVDGGDGSDTLNYLLNGNVFEAGATMNAVNFETIN